MRKLILITVLALASVTAQAGQPRSLILASNDTPATAEKIDSIKPDAPKADVKTEAPATQAATPAPEADEIKPAKTASKPASKTKDYSNDEAKARRIAARYGISW
jgi:outer membrane biosynthesis protein TonB